MKKTVFASSPDISRQVCCGLREPAVYCVSLARIFHPSLLRKPGKPMDAALDLNFDQDSMDSYSPDKNTASALPHQPSRLSHHESDEISGLGLLLGQYETYSRRRNPSSSLST